MTFTAEAIVFPGERQVEVRTVRLPAPGAEDVVVRTMFSGVSVGTERWYLTNQYRAGRPLYPLFPGYLLYGIVEHTGASVAEAVQPGEGVFLGLRSARFDPTDGNGLYAGCHISHAVCHQRDVLPVSPTARSHEVVFAGLVATALYGMRLGQVQSEDLVVVVGQGMVGQLAAQLCRLHGAYVITTDLIDWKVELSRRYSADVAINPSRQSLIGTLTKLRQDFPIRSFPLNDGYWMTSYEQDRQELRAVGVDTIIDTSGQSANFSQDVALIRREGKIILQGYFPESIPVDYHAVHRKAATVTFPCAWDQVALKDALEWIGQHKLTIEPLITHICRPSEAQAAYKLILESPAQVLGMLFDWR